MFVTNDIFIGGSIFITANINWGLMFVTNEY